MTKRREFLKYASAFSLGSLLLPACNTGTTTQTEGETATGGQSGTSGSGNLGAIGLQLYSVKDVLEQDLRGTLQQLADMGYKEVESYPGQQGHYYGMAPKEFSGMLRDMGLTLVSSHFGSGSRSGQAGSWQQATMLQNFQELAGRAAETGQKYLTCSWMDESLRKTPDDLRQTAELFNRTGQICKDAGLQFAYHNHDFEFKQVGDVVLYDYMLDNTDADLVKYELDMFWVVAGGQDPIAYFKKHPNRFPLGHVKDMDRQDRSKNTEIGSGNIDYAGILRAAKDNGMQHFLVEQETFTRPPLESMRLNHEYLAGLSI